MSKAIRRLLRSLLRKTYRFVERLVEDPSTGPNDNWAAEYTRNPLFVEMMEQPGCDHHYTWGVTHGVNLAKVLGMRRVSVLEFGVAGGSSLLVLERLAAKAESLFDVAVDVFGFDTGIGLTKPLDYRDMPNLWSEGHFPMDQAKLEARLTRAQLVLGPVGETVPNFMRGDLAPVAFAAFDVDLYSSTMDCFALFEAERRLMLPRVYCYFDDILGYTFGDHVGERLAISDFNAAHSTVRLSPIYGLRYFVPRRYAGRMWEKNYMAHVFDHPLYAQHDGSIPAAGSGLLGLQELEDR